MRYFTPGTTLSEIAVHDSAGGHIRSIGRAGQGPGEIVQVGGVQVSNRDTLWIRDRSQRQFHIFSPGGERFVRTIRAPVIFSAWLLLPSNEVVLGLNRITAYQGGRTVLLLSADGKSMRAIGPGRVPNPREPGFVYGLTFAESVTPGSFWVAEEYGNVIERWDFEGRVQLIVTLPASLLPPRGSTADGAPRPRIVEIREDRAGVLWIWIQRPNPNFRRSGVREVPLSELAKLAEGGVAPSEWVLALVDPKQKRIVLTIKTTDPHLFLGRDLFVKPTGPDESRKLTVFSGRVVRPPN